nr:prostate and testis expressed protein 3 isoform X1 [Vicugna pacos]
MDKHLLLLLSVFCCTVAAAPLKCVTCHLRTEMDRCRRGFGICVAKKYETCLLLKILQGKLEDQGRRCEIPRKFLGEYFNSFLPQTKASARKEAKCRVSLGIGRRGLGKMRQEEEASVQRAGGCQGA